MVSPKKILSTEEALARRRPIQVAASASFSDEQVFALDVVLTTLLRGGDVRAMRKSKALLEVHGKLPVMKAAIERQRERREAQKAKR